MKMKSMFQIKNMCENVLPGNLGHLEHQKVIKYNKEKK